MQNSNQNIDFEFCDFQNREHLDALLSLITEYMQHPMGGHQGLSDSQQEKLVEELGSHPSAFVVFIKTNDIIAGLATCFINYSTFNAAYFINIHDIIISSNNRSQGLGGKLISQIINIAREEECCKVNLEVRDDNSVAINLYNKAEFKECNPRMGVREFLL